VPEGWIGRPPAVTDRHGQGVVELLLIGIYPPMKDARKLSAAASTTCLPLRLMFSGFAASSS
jgi:hypothetical protein